MPPSTDDTSYIETDEPRSPAPLARQESTPLAPPRQAAPLAGQQPPSPIAPRQPGPRTSERTDVLFRELALAQLEFREVSKTRKASVKSSRGAYEYMYANLADICAAVMPALKSHGIVPMQIPMGDRVYVRVIHGPSGEWVEGGLQLVLPDYGANDTQRLGSALTYTRRYLLCMMLGIVAGDEDDDGAGAGRAA
jgi:hypothetical protein